MAEFHVEMRFGQDIRHVTADRWVEDGDWIVFHYRPPEGGFREHWRVLKECVVGMECLP